MFDDLVRGQRALRNECFQVLFRSFDRALQQHYFGARGQVVDGAIGLGDCRVEYAAAADMRGKRLVVEEHCGVHIVHHRPAVRVFNDALGHVDHSLHSAVIVPERELIRVAAQHGKGRIDAAAVERALHPLADAEFRGMGQITVHVFQALAAYFCHQIQVRQRVGCSLLQLPSQRQRHSAVFQVKPVEVQRPARCGARPGQRAVHACKRERLLIQVGQAELPAAAVHTEPDFTAAAAHPAR